MIFIYTDSAITPYNPGGMLTWAFLAKKDGKIIHSAAQLIGWGEGMTNNLGEYTAVVAAMQWLLSLPNKEPAIIQSDSNLVIKQIMGFYQCKDPKLEKLLIMIKKAKSAYPASLTFKWISRDKNTEADALSRTPYIGKEKAIEVLKARKAEVQAKSRLTSAELYGDDDLKW
jgi:ribonuclease HI